MFQIPQKAWIKTVFVKQGERLSLQTHENRSEVWIVLKGKAEAIVGEKKHSLTIGRFVNIAKKQRHRLSGLSDAYILELAFGNPQESDIFRFEDDYGRESA
jgi:mannose-6-phosphate isomerase-like protein (cupin superfamily)